MKTKPNRRTPTWNFARTVKPWLMAGVLLGFGLACSRGADPEVTPVYDVEVGPWKLEAEDYIWCLKYNVCDDPTASGGKVATRPGYGYMLLDDMPFPRTSWAVSIYLRVRPGSLEEQYTLLTTRNKALEDDGKRTRATLKPTQVGEWQWMQFAPVEAEDMGEGFAIQFVRWGATSAVACDCVVISTCPDLAPKDLECARPLVTSGPRAVVGLAESPPKLDGQGAAPCWQRTVACGDFLSVGSLTAAKGRTSVRMCYDKKNLYLFFVCQEPILSVAGQRRSEFLAKVSNRDGRVYDDDSVVVLLDPSGKGKKVFDFTVNALGTLADACCEGGDLWEGRNEKWNSKASASAKTGDGVWTVEIAIPFASLGGAPKPGDTWQACFGRLAKARKETSSWNPSGRGFHDPIQWGALVFGEKTPGTLLSTPASLQLGKNPFAVTIAGLAGQPSGAYLMVETTSLPTQKRSRQFAFVEASERTTEVTRQFDVSDAEELKLQYTVLDAATLTPWYASPALTRVARTSLAQVKLACDGPYELFLNDEVISRGAKAAGEVIKAPLQTGANVFALKLEQGTAAIRVEVSGNGFTAESWKVSAADAKDATRAGLDDRTWPMAKKAGDHPQLGPMVGESGKSVVLRRTLLWEKTRIWPKPEPAYYLARGVAQHIVVMANGLPGKLLDGWTTHVAVPPEFEVVGSTGYCSKGVSSQPKFSCVQLGLQPVDGRKMRVAKVTADKPVRDSKHNLMSSFDLFVRYREEAGEPKDAETRFLYWNEANDGNVSEFPRSINVRLLPKVNGRQPKKVSFILWGALCEMDDLLLRKESVKRARAAGFNDISDWLMSNSSNTGDFFSEYGMRLTSQVRIHHWYSAYLKAHPDQCLVTNQNQQRKDLMCTTALLGEGWPMAEEAMRESLDQLRPHTAEIDYEYGPLDGPYSCYCPRCLKAFREYAKLPPEAAPDPQTVAEKYKNQWADFMAHRIAQVFAKIKGSIHRHFPGMQFSVYSDYQGPETKALYGMDWSYVADAQGCDRAVCGYSPLEADMQRTQEALKGIPVLGGLILAPYDKESDIPVVPLTKTQILRMLLSSRGCGVMFYEEPSFDGRSWYAVGEVSRLAATYEEVFRKGKPGPLPGFDITQVQMLRVENITLVCALNITGKPAEYTIKLPVEAGAGAEFYSGTKVAAGKTVECSLEPGDAAVYVLRKPAKNNNQ